VIAKIETDEEVRKDTAHIERDKEQHSIMTVFGGQEAAGSSACWVIVRDFDLIAMISSGNGLTPHCVAVLKERLTLAAIHC